jgi:hypothetical protein
MISVNFGLKFYNILDIGYISFKFNYSMRKLTLFLALCIIAACGPKKEIEVCADKIRKEFNNAGLVGTVEQGCIIKYDRPNEFKVTGNAKIKITPDGSQKKIHLPKGILMSSDGQFIIDADLKEVKVRLISGSSSAMIGDKEVNLQLNQVMTVGGQ